MSTPRCRFNAGRCRGGLTLIEILLALSIAVVVIGIAFSLYRTVSQVLRGQTERARGVQTIDRALDQLRDDLAGAFLPADDETCAFMLVPDAARTGETVSVSFCVVRARPSGPDKRWNEVVRVEYLRETTRDAERLVRTERPLTGPQSMQPPCTNVLADALSRFYVAVFDGEDWRATWPMTKSDCLPRAARAIMANHPRSGKRAAQREFLISAGLNFTSSVQRVSSGP